MKKEKVFITGASGCVGHYVVDELKEKYELFLLVRSPGKLMFNVDNYKDIHVIEEDLDNISNQADLLSEMDYCIHIATAWGGDYTERINVHRAHEMFNLLNRDKLKRVIYFSTASILGRDMEVLEEAEKYGTEYIRTKSICFQRLPETKISDRIVTVFPTLVFGGDESHPFSHLTRSLPRVKKYSWLIGRLNVDAGFHFIHAEDIAKIVHHLLEVPDPEEKYVMGNEQITFGQFTRRAAEYFDRKIGWQITIKPRYVYRLLQLIRADISEWDRFCMEYGDFVYPVVNCESLGLDSRYSTVEEVLSDWKIAKSRNN
ncbi:MAG: NAD-dependent epimerase/dehydratase family protein [Bacillota bacterium]